MQNNLRGLADTYTERELNAFTLETLEDLYSIHYDLDVPQDKELIVKSLAFKVRRLKARNLLDGDLVMDFHGSIFRVVKFNFTRDGLTFPLIRELPRGKDIVALFPIFRINPFEFGPDVEEKASLVISLEAGYLDTLRLAHRDVTPGCFFIHNNEFANFIIESLHEQ